MAVRNSPRNVIKFHRILGHPDEGYKYTPSSRFGELAGNGEASDFLPRPEAKGDTAEYFVFLTGTEDLLYGIAGGGWAYGEATPSGAGIAV